MITCDEIIEGTKTIPANFNEIKATVIWYYTKQKKHLLLFYATNNKLKEVIYLQYKLKRGNKFKDIAINKHTYYFCDSIVNIKPFDPNKIKIYKNSYKSFLIYNIGYVTIKDSKYLKVNSVNPLYLFISKWILWRN